MSNIYIPEPLNELSRREQTGYPNKYFYLTGVASHGGLKKIYRNNEICLFLCKAKGIPVF